MPRTTRKMIMDRSQNAIEYIDMLDIALYDIEQLAAGRQPPVDAYRVPLLEMHELLRRQWTAFKEALRVS